MLWANRALGEHAQLRVRTAFARAWPDDSAAAAISPSTISRWESGRIGVSHSVVQRYEKLLELPGGTLVSIFDYALRMGRPAAPPALARRRRACVREQNLQLETRLRKACSADLVTGQGWDELTDLLAARPSTFLPGQMWAEVANRLLTEMLLACGQPWLQRYEAFGRLLTHPSGQEAAVDACALAGADPANQVMISTVAVLGASNHRDAISVLLKQLENPTDLRAQIGAMAALFEAATLGHLERAQRQRAARTLQDLLSGSGSSGSLAQQAHDLLRLLRRQDIGAETLDQTSEILADNTLPTRNVLVHRVCLTTLAAVRDRGEDIIDAELALLIEDLLFHPWQETRLVVAALLAATPYRAGLADALSAELKRGCALTAEPESIETALAALRMIGGTPEGGLIQQIVAARGLPPQTVTTAAFALGHFADLPDDRWWEQIISQKVDHWQRSRSQTAVDVLRGLAYSAGIKGRQHPIRRLRDDPAAPPAVRTAARWWAGVPIHVTTSAQL